MENGSKERWGKRRENNSTKIERNEWGKGEKKRRNKEDGGDARRSALNEANGTQYTWIETHTCLCFYSCVCVCVCARAISGFHSNTSETFRAELLQENRDENTSCWAPQRGLAGVGVCMCFIHFMHHLLFPSSDAFLTPYRCTSFISTPKTRTHIITIAEQPRVLCERAK